MADTVKRTEYIWMFGKRQEFKIYESSSVLHESQYHGTPANPERHQKNQIVMHYTAANNRAQNTISYWSSVGQIPYAWMCPNYPEHGAAHHNWGTTHSHKCPHCNEKGNGAKPQCPTHHVDLEPAQCPHHHGPVIMGHKFASAQYVMEVAQDRLTPDSQPYADVVEVTDSDLFCFHAGSTNERAVGIEHANVGWKFVNMRYDNATGNGAAKRPTDLNRYFRLQNHDNPGTPLPVVTSQWTNLGTHNTDFQAYQEEQYAAMIRLLRFLCIKHRIARRFLGDTTEEKMMRWWTKSNGKQRPGRQEALWRSRLMRFRGILSHMNCHDDKTCGGPALHRNRLFRGIIDEWWMPVEMSGDVRPYYMGPFDPHDGERSYIRLQDEQIVEEFFRDTRLDELQETRSYFDFDNLDMYYAHSEMPSGGFFPIGSNKIWHGGVHLTTTSPHRAYAAASGTIVAARVARNQAAEAALGSPCFVLIRHCVYTEKENDPDGGQRLNFGTDPKYFFSLYMHLEPVAHIDAVHKDNPPWFNFWRRRNADADATGVFCPKFEVTAGNQTTVEINVGDWIGNSGTFRNRRLIHFEIVSAEELTEEPWNNQRAHDTDSNVIANSETIDEFVSDLDGDGIDTGDVIRALPSLRHAKAFHLSEWALENADALTPLFSDSAGGREQRDRLWARLQPMMWMREAVGLLPELDGQLCDSNYRTWHYHPVSFMAYVNRLVLEENGEVQEPDMSATNVVMTGGFLTGFANFSGGSAQPEAADNQMLKPYGIGNNRDYDFRRRDIACKGNGNHNPGSSPPTTTRFALALLDILQEIKILSQANFEIVCSHLCGAHSEDNAANLGQCVLGTHDALSTHARGLAVDIRPVPQSPQSCRQLWEAATTSTTAYTSDALHFGGEPSHSETSFGCDVADVVTAADIQQKLGDGTALSVQEAARCIFHIELHEGTRTSIHWRGTLRANSRASYAKIYDGGVIGVYTSEAMARAEATQGQGVWEKPWGWETWLRRRSSAISVGKEENNIWAVYEQESQAVEESQDGLAVPIGS